jgi:predicted TIM-barrel fold metal-dependent hydrolase
VIEYFPKMEKYPDKFIFGSDWPGADIGKNIRLFNSLQISKEAKIKILYDNAKKLLRLN